jgi:hypothetical protein
MERMQHRLIALMFFAYLAGLAAIIAARLT